MFALMLTAALLAPAGHHDDPPPKHDDTGCCVSFDQSPVVICATKDACTFTGPKP